MTCNGLERLINKCFDPNKEFIDCISKLSGTEGWGTKLLCSLADNFTNCVIWIDLPRGSRWRAGKLATLQTVLKDIVKNPDCQIVCVTPFLRGWTGLSFAPPALEAVIKYLEATDHYRL